MITEDLGTKSVQLSRQLVGSWRLPQTPEGTAIVSFHPDGMFIWHNSTCDRLMKAREIVIGATMRGNWHVRNSLAAGQAWFGGWMSGVFGNPKLHGLPAPKRLAEDWYLVINFTALPESVLNLNLLGLRCDLANWTLNAWELASLHAHEILEITDETMVLSMYGHDQLWLKVR